MRERGLLVTLVPERATSSAITGEEVIVPAAAGDEEFGSLIAQLTEVPDENYGVSISGYTEVDALPVAEDEFYVDYRTGRITFNVANRGETLAADYYGRGSLIIAHDLNILSSAVCIPWSWTGAPDVTATGQYMLAIPLGVHDISSGSFVWDGGVGAIRVVAASVCAQEYIGDHVTGSTVIRSGNAVYGSETDYIDVTITDAATLAGRTGLGTGDIDVSDGIYVSCKTAGGHSGLHGWIWIKGGESV